MSDGAGEIHELDEDTVARIAAGEVVERPASAVKELVENSLDADASRIDVTVEEGGTELIRVADDGRGMSERDVRAAVRQHTTSKIDGLEDLEAGVATLGFRGEALHTIGSVSRLTIETRPRGGETGTKLVYDGGDVTTVEPTGCPEGTSVEVADLFYNTPARRKFLKTTATEFSHVNRVVTRYALANPDVAVSLTHDGREVFATMGQDDLQAAVLSVYGREIAKAMIPVEAEGEQLPVGPIESITGLVSHPETNRASRDYLATYVNGRAVTSEAIREGILGGYGTQLGGDRYPFVVLFLEVPGETVDVNVHPRKREVRFDDDDAVRRAVDSAVESALLEHGMVRSSAPRGRSAPAETRLEPERWDESNDEQASGSPSSSGSDRDRSARDASDDSGTDSPGSASGTRARGNDDDSGGSNDSGESNGTPDVSVTSDVPAESRARSAEPSRSESGGDGARDSDDSITSRRVNRSDPVSETGTDESGDRSSDRQRAGSSRDTARKFAGETDQRTLAGDIANDERESYDSLPALRVLGQLGETYLVCETDDGLVLIDQHAADERIHYERLREAFEDDPAAQTLASPVSLELTATESEAFDQYREALSRLGFYADRVDDRTVAVTTVPAVFEETIAPERLRDVLTSFLEGDRDTGSETIDGLADDLFADLACHPAITGNTSLTEGSTVELLEELDECENPYSCPHGRPVVVRIDESEIEARFERDYPGHD